MNRHAGNGRVARIAGWGLALAAAATAPAAECYDVFRASSPIAVDGRLDEPDWQAAEPVYFGDIVTGAGPALPATARLLWSATHLYAGFEVADTNVWARLEGRDAPLDPGFRGYTENFVKLYLDPDGDGRNYTEMHLSPNGALDDKWQTLPWKAAARRALGLPLDTPAAVHWDWNCTGMLWATAVQGTLNRPEDTDRGWTAEIAIPFAALRFLSDTAALPPSDGATWKAHLGRRYAPATNMPAAEVQYWTWPRVGERECHRADTWGTLRFRTRAMPPPADLAAALPSRPAWRMLWARAKPTITDDEAGHLADLAARMGFNQLCTHAHPALIRAAHARGLGFYAWWINLRVADMKAMERAHPERLQRVLPEEDAQRGLPRRNPDRENIHGGTWLCPDRGLSDEEWREMEAVLRMPGVDGLGLDYIGYRNYHACYCEDSNARRAAYARQHPELTPEQATWRFSEDALVEYTRQVRARVQALDRRLKLAIHVYPDFDPNPDYASRLPVDYCGQTVAWFFPPHWRYERVRARTARFAAGQHAHHAFQTFAPFVGIYPGDRAKSPDRLRTELRIAGAAGTDAIMAAFAETFVEQPDQVSAASEILNPPVP